MHVAIESRIGLDEPSADSGFVTWLNASAYEEDEDGQSTVKIASARFALIHVDAAEGELFDALDADSGDLERLYHLYFEEGGTFKEEFAHGFGCDLMHFDHVTVESTWDGKGVELAVVRRLLDAFGQGCEVVVMPYREPQEALWQSLGFAVTEKASGNDWGHMHMLQAFKQPLICGPADDGSFRVVPNDCE